MQTDSSITPTVEAIPVKKGIAVLSGYGLSVDVRHGQLKVRDGLAAARREASFSKATSGLSRLVILGHSGIISLAALRWLYDAKAAVVQIDADGNVLVASSPLNEGNNALRRAQVLARDSDKGIEIIRELISDKVKGEARVAHLIGTGQEKKVAEYAPSLQEAETISGIRLLESRAAAEYWLGWSPVTLRFIRRDLPLVPDHWRTFGSRISPITRTPRNAANPANALLNYMYAILEAETRIALLTIGLDPGLGLMHADQPNRDSLACDVMEAARPVVEEWLLSYLSNATFAAKDFFERPDGSVRVMRSVALRLAETAALCRQAVGPVAEWLAVELLKRPQAGRRGMAKKRRAPIPTKLTEANRSAGRAAYKSKATRVQRSSLPRLPTTCPECGKPVAGAAKRFCSKGCWQAYNTALVVPRLAKAGPKALADYRSKGADPGHGGIAARKRGLTIARRARERKEWEKLGLDAEDEKARFVREIRPRLVDVPIRRIAKATGWSPYYASLVRRGSRVPHPVYYPGLRRLIGELAQ